MTGTAFDEAMQTNFNAPVRLIEGLVGCFEDGGVVVNVVSRVGVEGRIGLSGYAASKGSLIGYTRGVARFLGSRRVNIHAVNPGFMVTDMVQSRKTIDTQTAASVLGKVARVEEAARFVFWVSGIRWTTGRLFDFDSRMYASWPLLS